MQSKYDSGNKPSTADVAEVLFMTRTMQVILHRSSPEILLVGLQAEQISYSQDQPKFLNLWNVTANWWHPKIMAYS
jgi:hypothetical protein